MGDGQHADRRNGNEPEFRGGQPASVAGGRQCADELEESMYLDGATRFQTLLHCIIPLSKPAIATQAVLAFNGYWSNLFDILTFTKSTNKRTLSVALQLFRGQYTTNYGLMFAASVIVIIPIIVLFVIFQKQFMQQGITDGSIKG